MSRQYYQAKKKERKNEHHAITSQNKCVAVSTPTPMRTIVNISNIIAVFFFMIQTEYQMYWLHYYNFFSVITKYDIQLKCTTTTENYSMIDYCPFKRKRTDTQITQKWLIRYRFSLHGSTLLIWKTVDTNIQYRLP